MTRRVLDEKADAEGGSEPKPAPDVGAYNLRAPRWLAWALVGVAALVFAAWLFLAVAHVDDRFQLDHVSGARMALARYFDEGTLYPELYEDGFYGGTRYMPVPIVLHGFLAELTGEYLLSGKLLSYAAMIGLLAAMFVLLRRQGCPVAIALALPALVLTTQTGLAAGMDIRGDALPLLLQVLAVGIVAGTARPAPTVSAAALAAIALLSKTSAVWAPVAIAIWLLGRDRRRLVVFLVAYVGIAGSLVLLFTILTQGRMLENVLGLSTSGITGLRTVLLTPYRFVHLIVDVATTAWAVVPLVALACWISLRRRSASIYVLSLVCALVVTLVVLIDAGTGWNQLIDLVVLSALVIGELVAGVRDDSSGLDRDAARTVSSIVALTLLWVTLTGFVVTLVPPALETARDEVTYDAEPLAGLGDTRISMLSEDPYVPISLGQTPVVLDPFMLPRLAETYPDAIPDLVERIEAHEFDVVVLVQPLEPVDRPWWSDLDLGLDVARAISREYAFAGRMQGYYLYEPREGAAA